MSAKEIPVAGRPTPPGDAFPRAADIFDHEAFALRLADARRRRERVLAERAAAARTPPPAPQLQPAALPRTPPAAATPPAAGRRGHWIAAAMTGVAVLGAVLLLLRPAGPLPLGLPLALPPSGPEAVVLAAPGTDLAGAPLLPRGLAPARVAPRPGALAQPQAEAARASDATSWVPKPMARPEDLRLVAPLAKRRAAVAARPPLVRGVERFLGRMGIRPVAPRPAGQRNPGT